MEWYYYVFVVAMWVITFIAASVCTKATMVGRYDEHGYLKFKEWFSEFKGFVIPLWIVAIVIFVLAPYCMS